MVNEPIKSLFANDIHRRIEEVIKVDQTADDILRDEINEAIDDGWSVKYIWEVLYEEGKITFSYQTFLNLVNKYKTNSSLQSKTIIAKKESAPLPDSESTAQLQPESESTQDRIKITDSPKSPDYGNPKGFEWSTDYDPKDFI